MRIANASQPLASALHSREEVRASTAPQPAPRARYAELDGLRGIAALAVLFYHYFGIFPDVFEPHIKPVPHAVWGSYGVQLFFVVSGFVIFMTLARISRPSDFVIGRIARLYPTYWCAVSITALIVASGVFPDSDISQHSFPPSQLLANLTMLQRFLNVRNLDGVYWTLAYELSFYAWVFVLLVTKQTAKVERYAAWYLLARVALVASLQAGVLELGARLSTLLMLEWGHLFVIGVMFYRMRTEGPSKLRHALIAFGCASELLGEHAQESLPFLVAIVLVFYGLHAQRLSWLRARPLVWLGSIWYALYALHEAPGWAMLLWLRTHGLNYWLSLALTTATAITAAWLITRFVERPAIRQLKGLLDTLRARVSARPALSSVEATTAQAQRE